MNEKYNHEIEELLNAYVDGEASQRQQTELKRLMMHDASISERISRLQRQKELLKALPVEIAPEGLAEDVRCALERKLILDNFSAPHHAAETGGFKRLLTAAAMLFIPIGVLGLIVFEIIKPAAPVTGPIAVTTDNKVVEAAGLPFNGVLTFETDEFAAVGSYIDKKIFDQGLSEQKVSAITNDQVSYTLLASPQKIAALVDSIKDTWNRSDSVWLSVAAQTDLGKIDIPAVKLEQVKTLALEGKGSVLSQLAADYASDNQKNSFYAKKNPGSELGPDGFPPLDQPIMTGRYKPLAADDANEHAIQLQIIIRCPQQQ